MAEEIENISETEGYNNSAQKNIDEIYTGEQELDNYYPASPLQQDASAESIKNNITGNYPNPYPLPRPEEIDFDTQKDMMKTFSSNTVFAAQDPNQYSKLYSYNSGPESGNTFFERYATRGAFKDINFHPLRNNEQSLNNHTHFLGDLTHSITHSFFPLVANGFISTYASMGQMLQGNFFGEDVGFARDYKYYTNLSNSSKNNLGSFINNLTLNFGYTVGILGTALFEGWAGATMGAMRGAGTYANGAKAIRNVRIGENIADAAIDGGNVVKNSLEHLDDISNARKFWNYMTSADGFITSAVGRAINPFSNLTDNYLAQIGKIDDISAAVTTGGRIFQTAGAFYRDIRNINLALAEGRLESGMNRDRAVNDLYNEYYEENGTAPDAKTMKGIVDTVGRRVGYESAVMNAGIIYFTNKLAFDNLLNPRMTGGILNRRIKEIGKIGDPAKGQFKLTVEGGEFVLNKPGFRTWLKGWKTDPIAKSLSNTAAYFKVNVLEGVQESLQEVIAEATVNYYKDAYNDKTVKRAMLTKAAFGADSAPMSYYGEGFKNQFTPEGFSIFASGFFMGFLSKGLGSGLTTLQQQSYKIYDRPAYDQYMQDKEKIGNELVDKLNAVGIEDFFHSRLFNAGIQARTQSIQGDEDQKHIKDSETEALVSHMTYLMEQGVFEQYINSFDEFMKMTPEEFQEAHPKVPVGEGAKYQAKIPGIIAKAKRIGENYKKEVKNNPNPIDMGKYKPWMSDYTEAFILHKSWNEAIKQKIFYNESWINVSDRMDSIKETLFKERPSQSLTRRDLDLLLDIENKTGLRFEIATLKTEIENLTKTNNPESIQLAKDKKKQLDIFEAYAEKYENFRKEFKRDEYRLAAIQEIAKNRTEEEADKPITEEDINALVDKEFGKSTTKSKEKSISELKDAYKNIVSALSNKNDSVFDTSVDESFTLVLDYYKLSDEKLGLVKLINLLNNPQGFIDVVAKNQDWMEDMWINRQGYFQNIVKEELQDIEDNGLLNALANDGIYISQLDFLAWRDHDIMPSEFYDEKNGMVVPQESITYEKYLNYLEAHKALANIKILAEDALTQRIKNLNDRRKANLDKLYKVYQNEVKTETGKTLEEVQEESKASDIVALDKEIKTLKEQRKKLLALTDPAQVTEAVKELGMPAELFDAAVEENLLKYESDKKVKKEIDKLGKKGTKAIATTLTEESIEQSRQNELNQAVYDPATGERGPLVKDGDNGFIANGLRNMRDQLVEKGLTDPAIVKFMEAYVALGKSLDETRLELEKRYKVRVSPGLEPVMQEKDWNRINEKYDKQLEDFRSGKIKTDFVDEQVVMNTGAIIYTAKELLDNAINDTQENIKAQPDVSVLENTKAYKTYQKRKDDVNKRYDALVAKLKERFEGLEEKKVPVKNSDIKVDIDNVVWNELEDDLQAELTKAFDKYLADDLNQPNLKTADKKEYLRLKDKWLSSDESKKIISDYLVKQEKLRPKTVEEVKIPKLKTFPKNATPPTKINQLDNVIKDLKNTLSKKKTKKEREDLAYDIEALTKYRNEIALVRKPQSPSQRSWNLFDTMVVERQKGYVERVLGENGETIGYRFAGSTPETPSPTRATQYAEQLKNKKFKLGPFEYGPVKEKNFNKKTGETYRGGLLNLFDSINEIDLSQQEKIDNLIQTITADGAYIQLQEPGKLAIIKSALEADFTLDSLKKVVNRVAFSESTIAGNTVDGLFRAALTIGEDGNFLKPSKPDNMSDEAFASITEIISELQNWAKDGDFFFYVGDALVFDQTAMENGVVGAMDILAFNRKTKEFHIIDIKTSRDFEDFPEAKMYQYSAQQSIYRNLLHNMTGQLPSQLSLLPIEVDLELNGYIKSVKKAGTDLNKERIDKLKAEKKKAKKARKAEIDIEIKNIEKAIAVDIPYIDDVEAGVPLVKPTDVPLELQAPTGQEESFDPFLTEEVREQFKDSKKAEEIEKIGLKIRNAKTIEEANEARTEAFIIVMNEPVAGPIVNKMLEEEYNTKKEALNNEISSENLSKGMYLVSETPIFENASDIVVISKVYKKGNVDMVTLKSIGLKKARQKSMSVEEANNLFDKATSDQVDTVIKATAEEKANAKTSKQNQKEYNKQNPVGKSQKVDADNDADIFGEEPNDC